MIRKEKKRKKKPDMVFLFFASSIDMTTKIQIPFSVSQLLSRPNQLKVENTIDQIDYQQNVGSKLIVTQKIYESKWYFPF